MGNENERRETFEKNLVIMHWILNNETEGKIQTILSHSYFNFWLCLDLGWMEGSLSVLLLQYFCHIHNPQSPTLRLIPSKQMKERNQQTNKQKDGAAWLFTRCSLFINRNNFSDSIRILIVCVCVWWEIEKL